LFSGLRVVVTAPKIRVWLRGTSPVAWDAAADPAAVAAAVAAADAEADGAVDASDVLHAATSRPRIVKPTSAFASIEGLASRFRDLLDWVCNSVSSSTTLDRLADALQSFAGRTTATVTATMSDVNMEYDIRDGSAS
jgi:hypothetical protein